MKKAPERTIEAARAAYVGKRIRVTAPWLQKCFGTTKLELTVTGILPPSASCELYLLIGDTDQQVSVFVSDDMTIELAD